MKVAVVPVLPKIPSNEEELVDDSSSPPERGLPTTNFSIMDGLMMSPSWTPSPKNKIFPSQVALFKDNRSNIYIIVVSGHNIVTPAPCK